MILNAKGWVGVLAIALVSLTISYGIYKHPYAQVIYQGGVQEGTAAEPTPSPTPTPVTPQIIIGDNVVNVRVASTSAQITKGLSGTLAMAPNEGMIFLFPVSDRYRFWMPDMHFAIDMIWIGANKKIIDITRNAQPLKDITKPVYYSPKAQVRYVLEVQAGWSDEHHITIGQTVHFTAI